MARVPKAAGGTFSATHQPSRSFTSPSRRKKPRPFLNTATDRVRGFQTCGFSLPGVGGDGSSPRNSTHVQASATTAQAAAKIADLLLNQTIFAAPFFSRVTTDEARGPRSQCHVGYAEHSVHYSNAEAAGAA